MKSIVYTVIWYSRGRGTTHDHLGGIFSTKEAAFKKAEELRTKHGFDSRPEVLRYKVNIGFIGYPVQQTAAQQVEGKTE